MVVTHGGPKLLSSFDFSLLHRNYELEDWKWTVVGTARISKVGKPEVGNLNFN